MYFYALFLYNFVRSKTWDKLSVNIDKGNHNTDLDRCLLVCPFIEYTVKVFTLQSDSK